MAISALEQSRRRRRRRRRASGASITLRGADASRSANTQVHLGDWLTDPQKKRREREREREKEREKVDGSDRR